MANQPKLNSKSESSSPAPVIFIGHGSPMNAIENNPFTQRLANLSKIYPDPKAILCISAHWMTEGTWVTHMARPKTIHDFYGFPQELSSIQYPAPGDPRLAERIATLESLKDWSAQGLKINLDDEMWGLDHGTWSVLRHVFPKAQIPVLQLSLHMEKPPQYHFELGEKLRKLREHGVLIIGSGNVVHNLRVVKWEADAEPFDWAVEFDRWIKDKLETRDFKVLVSDFNQTVAGQRSVPTSEHYLPLLYVLGASDEKDLLKVHFEGIQNGSISMRSFSFGCD